jgi:hypothetical protein
MMGGKTAETCRALIIIKKTLYKLHLVGYIKYTGRQKSKHRNCHGDIDVGKETVWG